MDEQREPVEAGHDDASRAEKLDGLVEQVRGDLATSAVDDVRSMIRDRLRDAGLPASERDVDVVAARVDPSPRAG
ncbi:hypothetical protein [Agromyces sp. NPDC058064]|uniref:hypothetical protein n=1 Tax=Agromyces sp. NPDC058064 TaxID=3346322 RepID=UPI0036D83666